MRFSLLASALLFVAAMPGIASAFGAPEVDPGYATSALTLLAGGALLLKGRFRREG